MITSRQKHPSLWRHVLAVLLLAFAASAVLAQGNSEPEEAAPLIEDGNFYLQSGGCALAQFYFQDALRIEPNNVDAHVGKGRALACQGAYPAAIEAYQAALAIDANHLDALVHLAITYQNQYQTDPGTYQGRLADALDVIQRAERNRADDARVQNTKGIILYQLNDLAQARTTLERAVSLAGLEGSGLSNSEKSTVQVNLGRTYRDLEELELALQAFRRAVVLDPASATAHNNLGNVAYRLGDCDMAEFELSQAVNLDPNSLSAASSLGIALFECGQVANSVPRLEAATKMTGAAFLPALFTYLARAYLEVGRVDDAVFVAQQGALLSSPESADAYYWLGRAYTQRGGPSDASSAQQAYQRALELDSGYAPAREALGQ
ncbi:MAG: tetratricopeptide repeat protein [Trueperaceae bacterium]